MAIIKVVVDISQIHHIIRVINFKWSFFIDTIFIPFFYRRVSWPINNYILIHIQRSEKAHNYLPRVAGTQILRVYNTHLQS